MMREILSQFDVSEGVAVVTGAGGALCGVLSRALGQAGVKVVVVDLNEKKANETAEDIRQNGGQAVAYVCNVLDEAALLTCYDSIRTRWGPPDYLINGAGGNDPRGTTTAEFYSFPDKENPETTSFFDLDIDGVQSVFNLNFLGTFLPTKVFAQGMVEKKKGSVVNISSMSALTPLTKVAAYSAAKAAVANLTRWMAVHFAASGVRVNALAPGFFMTEQLRFLHINPETGEYTKRAREVLAHTPMHRYGEPEELVGTVIYLLSAASRFVTGAVIPIDGGFSSYSI